MPPHLAVILPNFMGRGGRKYGQFELYSLTQEEENRVWDNFVKGQVNHTVLGSLVYKIPSGPDLRTQDPSSSPLLTSPLGVPHNEK